MTDTPETDWRARATELQGELDEAIKLMSKYAAEAGEAKGRLEMSEAAGMVDNWREHALAADTRREAAERRAATAEAALAKFTAPIATLEVAIPEPWRTFIVKLSRERDQWKERSEGSRAGRDFHFDAGVDLFEQLTAAQAQHEADQRVIEGLRRALNAAGSFFATMLTSPFWRETIDPVRGTVEKVDAQVRAALLEGGGGAAT